MLLLNHLHLKYQQQGIANHMDRNTSILSIFSILSILILAVQMHNIAYAQPLAKNSTKDKSPVLPYILATKLLNMTSPTKAQQVYVLTNTTLIFPQIAPIDTANHAQLGLPSQLGSSAQLGLPSQLGSSAQLGLPSQLGSSAQLGSSLLPTSNWHHVKIISPAKGQQVPIGKDLLISGISSAIGDAATLRTTPNTCKVYIIVNGVKPYQLANGIGPGGSADYSRWNFVLSPTYTMIKEGSHNKITAKYICGIDPRATSFYSRSVTGVPATVTPVASSPHIIDPSHSINTASSKQQVAPANTFGTSITENSPRTTMSSNPVQNYHGMHDFSHRHVHGSSASLVQKNPGKGDINSGFNPYIFPFER
jgi:hypothetical protein